MFNIFLFEKNGLLRIPRTFPGYSLTFKGSLAQIRPEPNGQELLLHETHCNFFVANLFFQIRPNQSQT